MRPVRSMIALLLLAPALLAQERVAVRELSPTPKKVSPPAGASEPLSVGEYRCFAVEESYKGTVTWEVVEGAEHVWKSEPTKPTVVVGLVHGQSEPSEVEYPPGSVILWGRSKGIVKVFAYGVVDGRAKRLLSLSFAVDGSAPQPPPGPTPEPRPPEPKPVVASFRVILGYETGKNLTPDQNSVLNGKVVQEWLRKNTTPEGGLAGFRRFDKDTDASNDQPDMRRLWEAVKPKVTTVPFAAIEVNGRVEIVPFERTPEEMVAVFKKYKGD